MKIAFIEPAQSKANFYSRLQMPLLGPIYLGTILKQRGHQVTIYNENFCPPDYSRLEADLVGISILTSTAKRGYEIARKFPKEKVIFGGVHASLLPEEPLQFCRQVVTGEAEGVIADVAEGRVSSPIVRGKPVEDLDALPFPDFSLVAGIPRSMLVQPVSTSRGCPFDCSFCSVTRVFGRKYRFRSAESIVKELGSAIRREIFFCDDNFCADRDRLMKLMRMFRSMKRKFSWTCQARCEAGRDEELLSSMKSAGCSVVCLGLESVNDRTLKSYNKGQSVQGIVSAIRAFHSHGIKVHGMFVLGGDHADERSARETLDFSIRNEIDTIQIFALTPFPGTRTHEQLSGGGAIFSRDWELYDGLHVVFKPERLSPLRLQQDILEAHAAFYSLRNALSL
ncbi:MAG: B12-binding domain-containing radical SAM protein, partial [Deltaproteobacteria bacterium]